MAVVETIAPLEIDTNMEYLSYDQYREVMYSLNGHLSEFVSVEDAIMSCGIRKPFDFNASSSRLIEIDTGVRAIRESLSTFVNQPDGNYSINTAITYIDLLLASIEQLTAISQNLAKKANGMKYGFLAYRKELKDYRRKEDVRVAMGDELNSALSRPW
jgi:hypothetical protein